MFSENKKKKELFIKKLNVQSGLFYHIFKPTGEIIWDFPHNIHVPLEKPSDDDIACNKRIQHICMDKKKKERAANLLLINSRIKDNQRIKKREKNHQEALKEQKTEKIWKDSFEKGKKNGKIRIAAIALGHISEKLYTFEKCYGIKLTHLSLMDLKLSNIGEISVNCTNLVHLSLASNYIETLDEKIGNLIHLRNLNLLGNKLKALPLSIGSLVNLAVLELANNKIVDIPPTLQNLVKLKRLNLECNKIQYLPETMVKLKLEILILNSNNLKILPHCLFGMTQLNSLFVNDNYLTFLPSNIGNSNSIETLHASRNQIMELPKSLGKLETLQSLWLAYNKLTALPVNFHGLINLKDLNMEGNLNMVYPTMETIISGSSYVLDWSRKRFAEGERARKLTIVLCIQDVLKQVEHYKISGSNEPHHSIFESNVLIEDEKWYQFPPESFWEIFIPSLEIIWSDQNSVIKSSIKSFPYDKTEMESALATFQDASGFVMKYDKGANFRLCSCKDKNKESKKCSFPKDGRICQRPAMLVKSTITLERHMTEKKRREMEQHNIEKAVTAAIKIAEEYLSSDEGMILIRKLAEQRVYSVETPDGLKRFMENTNNLFLEEQQNLNWDRHTSHVTVINRIKKIAKLKINRKNEIKEFEIELKKMYIDIAARRRRTMMEEMSYKMNKVMNNWLGLSMEEVFIEWKKTVKLAIKRRQKDKKNEANAKKIAYEGDMARLELAQNEIKNWIKYFDEFNDQYFWEHKLTQEIRWYEPKLEHFLPSNWIHPQTPSHVKDYDSKKKIKFYDDSYSDTFSSESDHDESKDDSTSTEVSTESEIESAGSMCAENCRGYEAEIRAAALSLITRRRSLLKKKSSHAGAEK